MSDYSELKRLATAANAVTGDVSVDISISSERGPNQPEIDSVTAFVGAATPAAVLALIAENEALNRRVNLLVKVSAHQRNRRNYWIKQCCDAERVAGLSEHERKDIERLDWLDGRSRPVIEGQCMSSPEGELVGYDWGVFGQCSTVREAIDAAMAKEDQP